MVISLTERKVRAYVPYMGSYLYIDEFGRVLEINSQMSSALPVVTGLKFDTFMLGEKINAENNEISVALNAFEVKTIRIKVR